MEVKKNCEAILAEDIAGCPLFSDKILSASDAKWLDFGAYKLSIHKIKISGQTIRRLSFLMRYK